MKLTVNSKQIALKTDAKISIERTSPYLNDDSGSFSFPFPVPTLPNQKNLSYPGKLTRSGDMPEQAFILEEEGQQVLRGLVEYDDISDDEMGLVLKSGMTEFYKRMEQKKLKDIDFGSETWPTDYGSGITYQEVIDMLASWDAANITDNGKYAIFPFWVKNSKGEAININIQDWSGPMDTKIGLTYTGLSIQELTQFPQLAAWGYYCLQFYIYFIIQKIFESQGYTVQENSLSTSIFNKAVIFGKVMSLRITEKIIIETSFLMRELNILWTELDYASLMPDIAVKDFLSAISNMFCIVYEIDELKKEVRIKFKKELFEAGNLSALKITELKGGNNREERVPAGFALKYADQDSDLDIRADYTPAVTVDSTLPAPKPEGIVYHVTATDRDYIVVKNDNDDLEWQEIGRLKQKSELDGENVVEINVKVPAQKMWHNHDINLEGPDLPGIILDIANYLTDIPLAVTLYQGRQLMAELVNFPFATFDRYSLGVLPNDDDWDDGSIDFEMSLKPAYLYNEVYADFLNWQTYRARGFMKYILIPLKDLVAMQWGKRYMIGGVQAVLDKISYDIPFEGKVEVIGFTT